MSDADAPQELVTIDPPELRVGNESRRPRRRLEALCPYGGDERVECLLARPGVVLVTEVAANDRMVVGRTTSLRAELVHRRRE